MAKSLYILIFTSLFLQACFSAKPPQTHNEDVNKGKTDTSRVTTITSTVDSAAIKKAIKIKSLKEKFPNLLDETPDSLTIRLYSFIDEWLHTPFKWGGMDKNGIDCSAFVQRLFNDVYNLKIPRTSIEQVYTDRVERFRAIKYLAEGDILFFRTMNDKIVSHVGFYLGNYKFVNASSIKGVAICSLLDDYWSRHFVIAARVKVFAAKKASSNISMR
jgi:cell wall-associated NlpC family hydrolase